MEVEFTTRRLGRYNGVHGSNVPSMTTNVLQGLTTHPCVLWRFDSQFWTPRYLLHLRVLIIALRRLLLLPFRLFYNHHGSSGHRLLSLPLLLLFLLVSFGEEVIQTLFRAGRSHIRHLIHKSLQLQTKYARKRSNAASESTVYQSLRVFTTVRVFHVCSRVKGVLGAAWHTGQLKVWHTSPINRIVLPPVPVRPGWECSRVIDSRCVQSLSGNGILPPITSQGCGLSGIGTDCATVASEFLVVIQRMNVTSII